MAAVAETARRIEMLRRRDVVAFSIGLLSRTGYVVSVSLVPSGQDACYRLCRMAHSKKVLALNF